MGRGRVIQFLLVMGIPVVIFAVFTSLVMHELKRHAEDQFHSRKHRRRIVKR